MIRRVRVRRLRKTLALLRHETWSGWVKWRAANADMTKGLALARGVAELAEMRELRVGDRVIAMHAAAGLLLASIALKDMEKASRQARHLHGSIELLRRDLAGRFQPAVIGARKVGVR